MSRIHALFQRQFPSGARISCDWQAPCDRFSVTVLFGPSGCGKTTILRCLAGLDQPTSGEIHFGSEVWFAPGRTHLAPQRRGVGFLFQDYALFPHLTIAQNVGFSLRRHNRATRDARVASILERFRLAGLEDRYPHQISGGQQQRAALARAVVCHPRLLLLDEPLSALDAGTRDEIRRGLRPLLADVGIPVVIVTHDRLEAMTLADQVLILKQGQVLQSGPTESVFSRPASLEVAEIVGVETVAPVEVLSLEGGLARIRAGTAELTAVARPDGRTGMAHVCIRAEDVILETGTSTSSARNHLPCVIAGLAVEGPLVRVLLDGPFPLTALVTRPAVDDLRLAPGTHVTAVIKAPAVHLIVRD